MAIVLVILYFALCLWWRRKRIVRRWWMRCSTRRTSFARDLGRNEACYGNLLLSATPREDAAAFSFEQAGDRVPVADIQSLQLSAMSLTDETGVALMALQAKLVPDTLPGQNVTVLLFGDVQVTNTVDGGDRSADDGEWQRQMCGCACGTDQNNVIASLLVGRRSSRLGAYRIIRGYGLW
ncbi:MAG: hypothetical protein U0694_16570 [Anaerolineae bacterium]